MIRIIDSTLREGMQSAAGCFTVDHSVETAALLARCGVDTIECGHPAIGQKELMRVAEVVQTAGDVPVLAHARAHRDDIDAVVKSGAAWVGIFLGVNETSRRSRLPGRSLDDLYDKISDSVTYAREMSLRVRFTAEDSSRTEPAELLDAYRIAIDAGADRICFADTLGVLEPDEARTWITRLRAHLPDVPLEVHFHDDRGLALANALAAIEAGARWVSASVNGLGERAGIVDLAALVMNLHYRGDRPMGDGVLLQELSRRVGAFSRSMPDHRRPVVGRDVFHHTVKLHVRAVRLDPAAYEWIDPGVAGRQRSTSPLELVRNPESWIVAPPVIAATELRHHRAGPGQRYVLVDNRFVTAANQYCIARRIPLMDDYGSGHVDTHVHDCDSLFVFLGEEAGYAGLSVEVTLAGEVHSLQSPASVFIPAGVPHGYRVVGGAGTYLNHVLAGDYNSSLLDPIARQ